MKIKLDPVRDLDSETLEKISTPERDRVANAILNMHSRVDEPIVIGIDGEWGTGKTVFLKRLIDIARKREIRSHYFDAFEHDISQDAFISLASSISIFLNNEYGRDAKDKFVSAAARVGKSFLMGVGEKAVAYATGGLVDRGLQNTMKDAAIGPQSNLENLIDQAANRSAALSELRAAIVDAQEREENNKNILFVIDELDRCRPDFAIEILECVKHIFSVPGVNYILGANFDQLSRIVEMKYGSSGSNSRYFEKFLDFNHSLSSEFGQGKTGHEKILNDIRKNYENKSHILKGKIFTILAAIYHQKGYSIRTFIKTLEAANLAFLQASDIDIHYHKSIAIACSLKLLNYKLYNDWLRGDSRMDEIWEYYNVSSESFDIEEVRRIVDATFNLSGRYFDNQILNIAMHYIEPGAFGDER